MVSRRAVLGAVGGGAALVGGGFLAVELFAPERATRVEARPAPEGVERLSSGTFVGKGSYRVSGRVSLVRAADGHALLFEEYEQTQGPDVFVYLTPAPDPDTREAVAAGRKVLLEGGADGGESTLEGTFTQALDGTVDPADYRGVAVWCERFSVPFGAATLEPVTPATPETTATPA